jgi:uncharacterized protein YjbI with pentapeptide repeats
LDKIWFRVLISLVIAYTSILVTSLIGKWSENQVICNFPEPIQKCILRQTISAITPSNIEGFSILAAASLYILESRERRQRVIYEAWQVIDNASGVRVSYARIEALKTLNKYKVSLKGMDLSNTDLSQIELEKAKLNGIDFSTANLNSSNLSSADLNGANLSDAYLGFSNFSSAQLSGADMTNTQLNFANFSNTNLSGADFTNANCISTNFSNTNLSGIKFYNVEMGRANFSNSDLWSTDFTEAKNLTPEQIKNAKNWERAIYNETFRTQLGLPPSQI